MDNFLNFTEDYCREVAISCTECGLCVEACPIIPLAGLESQDAGLLVSGLKSLSEGKSSTSRASDWLDACNGSGICNDVCPENINVRSWISGLRTIQDVSRTPERDRRKASSDKFRAMSQAIRLLSSMQLPPDVISKITRTKGRGPADVVFYTGCNVLRTPHIVMNMMEILDALEILYEIAGGTSFCCGVTQHRSGDIGSYERVASRTSRAFEEMKAQEVISWCPTCLLQFNENWVNYDKPDYAMAHVTQFLHKYLDKMRSQFANCPPRRVVLQEHDGIPGVTEHVTELLASIPHVELVPVKQNRNFGYVCGGIGETYPDIQRENYRMLLEGAVAAQADCVVTIYHSCQRMLAGAAAQYPLNVLNYTDLISEALGRPSYTDIYGTLARVDTMDTIIETVHQLLKENGVEPNHSQIELVANQMFGEPGFYGSKEEFVENLEKKS